MTVFAMAVLSKLAATAAIELSLTSQTGWRVSQTPYLLRTCKAPQARPAGGLLLVLSRAWPLGL